MRPKIVQVAIAVHSSEGHSIKSMTAVDDGGRAWEFTSQKGWILLPPLPEVKEEK